MKRIPPKGTQGHRMYWSDRSLVELQKYRAEEWSRVAQAETDERRKLVLATVFGYEQAAHDKLRELWEQTDYFAFNEKGTST